MPSKLKPHQVADRGTLFFIPHGPFAYIIEELSGNVTAFKYNDGQFMHLQNH